MVIPLCPEYRLTYVVFILELLFKQGHTITLSVGSEKDVGISKAAGQRCHQTSMLRGPIGHHVTRREEHAYSLRRPAEAYA